MSDGSKSDGGESDGSESDGGERYQRVREAAHQRLGFMSTTLRSELRILAGMLDGDERIDALAIGSLEGRSRLFGQLVVATDRRLLFVQGSGRGWVEELPWAQVTEIRADGSVGTVVTGAREWRFRKATPLTEFPLMDELRAARSGARACTEPAPARGVAVSAMVRRVVGRDAWLIDPGNVPRLVGELLPDEEVLEIAWCRSPDGLVVLTGTRIGLVPSSARGTSHWFERADALAVALDAGMLLRAGDTTVHCGNMTPAGQVHRFVEPLRAERRPDVVEQNELNEQPTTGTGDAPARIEQPVSFATQKAAALDLGESLPSVEPPEVHRDEIDGVPVFWADLPGRLKAHLIFGAGQRDEPFVSTGITHLAAHHALRTVGRPPYSYDLSVGAMATDFSVAGSPADVVRHLTRLSAALGRVDLAAIAASRAALIAQEELDGGQRVIDTLPLEFWFGNQGPGVVGNRELALDTSTPDEIGRWWRRWFHRGNAALVLTKAPPDGLRLPLPSGSPTERAHPAPLELSTPAWTDWDDGLMLVFHERWSTELAASLRILQGRLEDRLCRETGTPYDLDLVVTPVEADRVVVALGGEVDEDHAHIAAELMLSTVDELCVDGPTAGELTRHAIRMRDWVDDPEIWAWLLRDSAIGHLLGVESTVAAEVRGLPGLRPGTVGAALRAARGSMVLVVPDGRGLPELVRLPADPVVAGTSARRPRLGSVLPAGSRLVVAEDGLSLRHGGDEAGWQTVRYDDVVGLGIDIPAPGEEVFVLFSARGPAITLRAVDWTGSRPLMEQVLRSVPMHVHYRIPERYRPDGGW